MRIQHPGYVGPRKRLREALDEHRPGHMVFLIGPSGVGKTTMRHSVMQEMFGKPAYWGRGRIPAIETFVTLPKNAYFSSRELAKAMLNELHAPTLDWLFRGGNFDPSTEQAIKAELAECASTWNVLRPRQATEGEYWGMIQRSLPVRGCKYVSLDQVTALLVNHRDTSPADHILNLMVLAETTGVMFIMTGVQSASRLWAVHSELRRRVVTVWVPPYSDRRPQDRLPFLRLLTSLSTKYSLSREDLLLGMPSDILAATGGVFAEIVQLLDRAKDRARAEGRSRLSKRDIEASYYPDADLKALTRDIDSFEESMLAGDVSKRSALIQARWAAAAPVGANTE